MYSSQGQAAKQALVLAKDMKLDMPRLQREHITLLLERGKHLSMRLAK